MVPYLSLCFNMRWECFEFRLVGNQIEITMDPIMYKPSTKVHFPLEPQPNTRGIHNFRDW
jgi:hypothetical protein